MPALPPSVLADPLWAHLAANWKPIPKRPGYVLGLITSALAIVLIPLLYFGLAAGCLCGSVYLVLHRLFQGEWGRGTKLEGVIVLLAAAIAITIFVFLLKPFFAPSQEEAKSVQLKQFEELKLHSFVENVCAIIGSPAPKRIDITCEPNASAGFGGGILGALFQTQPVLTIGLSLVAGMSRAQLAGVLAHEFGHFSQGTGMRVSVTARLMVAWVSRAAFQRDAWDIALLILSEHPEPWMRMVAYLGRFATFLARLAIMPVALLGVALCFYTMRQMEFDADRYEVQLDGSATFERATLRIGELAGAYPRAVAEVVDSFRRTRQLPDDFPAYIAALADRLTPEQRLHIRKERDEEKRSLFDTHPSDPDRIAAARAMNMPGLLHDDAPASTLFQDFGAACRKATVGEFDMMLGVFAVDARYVPVAAEVAQSKRHATRAAILPRYLGFDPPTWRPLFPTIRSVPDVEDAKRTAQRLRLTRTELKDKARAAREHSERYRAVAEELLKWEMVRTVMDAGLRVSFKKLDLESTTRPGVSHRIEHLTQQSAAAADIIDDAGDMAMHRLSASLAMLGVSGIERHIPDAGQLRRRTDRLLAAAATLRELLPIAANVRRLSGASTIAIDSIRSESTYESAKKLLRPCSDDIRNRLDDARRLAGGTPDPFRHEQEEANLGASLVGASPGWRDVEEILDAGALFVQRFPDMYRRVLGELVEIGEHVERSIAGRAQQPLEPTAMPDAPARPKGPPKSSLDDDSPYLLE